MIPEGGVGDSLKEGGIRPGCPGMLMVLTRAVAGQVERSEWI